MHMLINQEATTLCCNELPTCHFQLHNLKGLAFFAAALNFAYFLLYLALLPGPCPAFRRLQYRKTGEGLE